MRVNTLLFLLLIFFIIFLNNHRQNIHHKTKNSQDNTKYNLDGWDGGGGREVQEGGDIGIHITDSLRCTSETNTTL